MTLLEYHDDFEDLCARGIFTKLKAMHSMNVAGVNEEFSVSEQITAAVLRSEPMPVIVKKQRNDLVAVLEQFYKLGEDKDEDRISTNRMLDGVERLIDENTSFSLIKKIKRYNFRREDAFVYLYLIWETILGYGTVELQSIFTTVYDSASERVFEMQNVLSGQNELVQKGLIEIIESDFFNDAEVKLSDTSIQLLEESDLKLFSKNRKRKDVIDPADIVYRELIFDGKQKDQLDTLHQVFREDKFLKMQERLIGKGLPKGVTVLLHGAPGTGKTEVVKQLAKATGRKIMKVEISESKSMWFGESEKNIKRIFTAYEVFAKECEQTLILLFNEADAIFSKRKENSGSSVNQTENAIQNILLEELENFEGILMATTNLAHNLDSAFDRRFLFKIVFDKPEYTVRAKIWKLKLPHLALADCGVLAQKYNLSGGQIDNVVRKSEIQEIVHGTGTDFERIQLLCEEELIDNDKVKIGFRYLSS